MEKTKTKTTTTDSLRRESRWFLPVFFLVSGLCSAGVLWGVEALTQGAGEPLGPPTVSPASPTAPPEIFQPALPSELQSADRVFKELDVANRGYVTLDDTKNLIGFENVFKAEDSQNSGKLSLPQFRRAWAIYTRKQ